MENKYCVFEVYDYKGGELMASINLTKEEFIRELSGHFESYFEEEDPTNLEEVKNIVKKALGEEDLDFYCEYAGENLFCGELYKISNNSLETIYFEDYIDDIADYIFNEYYK